MNEKAITDPVELWRRIRVLKEALLKEKHENETLINSKKDVDKELERTRGQLSEKENYLIKLKDEVADLQVKQQLAQKKIETHHSPTTPQKPTDGNDSGFSEFLGTSVAGLSAVFGLKKYAQGAVNDELHKLQQENSEMKTQLQTVKDQLKKAEDSNVQSKDSGIQLKEKMEGMQKRITELETELENRLWTNRELDKKGEEMRATIQGLEREKERLEQSQARLTKDYEMVVNERDEFEKEHNEKARIVQELNEVCQKMERELTKKAEEVKELSTKLNETELKMQIFELRREGKIMETPALIMIRRNVIGEYIIEIETEGDKLVIYPQTVLSFGPVKETEDKFFFDYKDEHGEVQKNIFHAVDRKRVLKSLKIFVKLADSNQANLNSKDTTPRREKNLLSQMVSFFNN